MPEAETRQNYQEALLLRLLRGCFGELDESTLALLRGHLEWVELAGGETLMEQGAAGDSMYVSVSGRLRVYVRDEIGQQRMVRELTRGQVIGELALFTGEPRSARVVAIRQSVLVRLSKSAFEQLLHHNPGVSVALTRQLIQRLLKEQSRSLLERPVTMALVPISDGVDMADFCARLAAPLSRLGRVRIVDVAVIEAELQRHGMLLDDTSAEADRRVALALDEIEATAEFVLLVADATPTAWTQRCTRHCDELLLLADATQPPLLHATEQQCLSERTPNTEAAEVLVLLHPAAAPLARPGTRWLARRAVSAHVHLRLSEPERERDFARLARLQSRTAVGLVLGGGGARGFAHLGVMKALAERGIEVDCIGGTSIGAVMATLAACDQPLERVFDVARRTFALNPTRDFNPIPIISLIKGQRLKRVIRGAMKELLGGEAQIEELWKDFYCIATNYTQVAETQIRSGPLLTALLASSAIPGALPPVVRDGDLLCDGGTFNNFPVDVMQMQRGVGTVIGIDLGSNTPRRIGFDETPSWWTLALDRLRPRARRRYKLPSLPGYLMNVSILYSASRRKQSRAQTDLCFNPPLNRVGLLQWDQFDNILRQGYDHGKQVLDELDAAALARLGAR